MKFATTDRYVVADDLRIAVNAAVTLQRPLLVKGEPGTGKTELARQVAQALDMPLIEWHVKSTTKAQQGLYEYDAVSRLRDSQLGLIQQTPPLPPRQRVVTAVLAGRLGQWSLAKSLCSLLYPLDTDGAADALVRLDLSDKLFQRCDELSGGQLQRVGIARVLYQQARLILADEPVSAMDPVLAGHTLSVLNQEAESRGITLLASLHAVDLALAHFPRIIGVRDGQIMFDLPASAVDQARLDALYANEQLSNPVPASIPAAPTAVHIPRC